MNKITNQKINNINFQLAESADLSFLSSLGEVFAVFDQNDSGNISFGVKNKVNKKFFIKIAGLQTCNMKVDKTNAIQILNESVEKYHQLADPQLITLIDAFYQNELFITIFEWFDGECLFDHWNFDFYAENPEIISPNEKFRQLSVEQKVIFTNKILSFLEKVDNKNYAAIDFYDSSIIYNFKTNDFKVCDIDLFQKMPTYNKVGKDFWGSQRMKSPEEYLLNEPIDSRTNVFKAGALFMNLFGRFTNEQYVKIYDYNELAPVHFENFSLPYELYLLLLKSVHKNPQYRYQTISEFKRAWIKEQKLLTNISNK